MADKNAKNKDNVNGLFFVDDQCIACDACVIEAPSFFKINEEEGHAYVFIQPKTEKEKEECVNALEGCPVEAIGMDRSSTP